jgi:hypothetical protein
MDFLETMYFRNQLLQHLLLNEPQIKASLCSEMEEEEIKEIQNANQL